MIKAIVFDLDDTLILEKNYIISGYKHISKRLSNHFEISENDIFNILIESFEEDSSRVFNLLYEKLTIRYTIEDIKELIHMYRNHEPDIEFIDGVIPTLEKLKLRGYKLGLITDGYKITQNAKIKVLEACDYFDYIIVTDELGREFWKPHPRAFELMKEELNVGYDEMVYVGDNPTKDFYIKATYPIITFRIKRKESVYQSHEYFNNVFEDESIEFLDEIIHVLNEKYGGN